MGVATESGDRKVLLVVDDSKTIRRAVEMVFSATEYAVVGVSSAAEALSRAASLGPALALIDADMPGVDGYELIRHFKANAATEELPILLLVAEQGFDRTKVEAAEADGHVTKPFRSRDLLDVVKMLTGGMVTAEGPRSFEERLELFRLEQEAKGKRGGTGDLRHTPQPSGAAKTGFEQAERTDVDKEAPASFTRGAAKPAAAPTPEPSQARSTSVRKPPPSAPPVSVAPPARPAPVVPAVASAPAVAVPSWPVPSAPDAAAASFVLAAPLASDMPLRADVAAPEGAVLPPMPPPEAGLEPSLPAPPLAAAAAGEAAAIAAPAADSSAAPVSEPASGEPPVGDTPKPDVQAAVADAWLSGPAGTSERKDGVGPNDVTHVTAMAVKGGWGAKLLWLLLALGAVALLVLLFGR